MKPNEVDVGEIPINTDDMEHRVAEENEEDEVLNYCIVIISGNSGRFRKFILTIDII